MGTLNDFSQFAFFLQGLQASDQAIKSTDANVAYYGFVNREGAWYIQEQTRIGSGVGSTMTYRYAQGTANFDTNWGIREDLTYARWDTTFK